MKEEAWCEKSREDVKELRRIELPVKKVSEARRERKGEEPGAAPSSAVPPNIRNTRSCLVGGFEIRGEKRAKERREIGSLRDNTNADKETQSGCVRRKTTCLQEGDKKKEARYRKREKKIKRPK
ncbi:uncharacterized protein MONOS_6426 [Monocercomonoides exilis]|uniref:uncharacterized protein n=1 Tax=Monocercomonoides exilis TaxID=2049356 RepID=UPI00355A7388|nr:hypothetical protein MONOS_6426 [Monocercomonoides exilis]|eukprot:MONOS_6426.1-p1 / transcript=MONOS_6426.1 / gene=MONOS_6426 / organism=Monocercomonoides_exilis_PA203 / gene_product=unspecified product / transcript_product=unspecified product / location=Mono_scaffold00202:43348-43791(-) / protein_length=124 / sequence_SO=supercontig / SO=protein_coding / is_pseudo=false